MIETGRKPEMLKGECSAAYDAVELLGKKGPLSQATADRLVGCFDLEGALALLHYVGFYSYMCTLLNGCDVQLPDGESIR